MIYEIDETISEHQARDIDDTMSRVISMLDLKESVFVTFVRSENTSGGCIELEGDEYLVEIPVTDDTELFVLHEMKHVEQYNTGRLKQGEIWLGKSYRGVPYYSKPWEKEAYKFEKNVNRGFTNESKRFILVG